MRILRLGLRSFPVGEQVSLWVQGWDTRPGFGGSANFLRLSTKKQDPLPASNPPRSSALTFVISTGVFDGPMGPPKCMKIG